MKRKILFLFGYCFICFYSLTVILLFSSNSFAEPLNISKNKQLPTIKIITIGHKDHGKSTLTKAITKVLPYKNKFNNASLKIIEYRTDKANYIHIDFRDESNYPYLKKLFLADGELKIDGAILIVSAVDESMPQTREHLKIAKETGLENIIIYINKIDLVNDQELRDIVENQVRELLTDVGFEGNKIPIIWGSSLMALIGRQDNIGINSALPDLAG